ncbi:MAG: glycosyltransferase family 2 protein [Clostridiales bacterium]|nr:glycosyltransferase family 2 protein [Clostridiales bacterium]
MSIKKIKIDQETFGWEPGGTFIISGWKVISPGETAVFQVLDESGTPVDAECISLPRPDVVTLHPDYAALQADLGFQITVPDIEHFFEEHQKLIISVLAGDTSRVIYARSTEKMKKAYFDSSIQYFLDVCGCIDHVITIRGWIVDRTGECFPQITDENGVPLPVQPKRSIRPDLVDALHLNPDFYQDHSWGFSFTMPREEFHGSALLIRMQNPYTDKSIRLSTRRLAWMGTSAGRCLILLTRFSPGRLWGEIRRSGPKGFLTHLRNASTLTDIPYANWRKQHLISRTELRRQKREHFPCEPLLSIVIPLYNTPERYLQELLDSLLAQTYSNFEVCLADGSTQPGPAAFIEKHYGNETRICLKRLKKNNGISENTNAAIRMAKGEFLVFSDHDDLLEPDALYELVKLLNENPALDLIYTDEDLTDESSRHFSNPRFKPDFNPDFLRSINYICHLTMVRTSLAFEVGLLRKQCDGAQDHDFFLRCIEKTDRVGHIPKILYHWRAYSGSTAGNQDSKQYAIDAGMLALTEHYERLGYEAEVEYTDIFIMYRMRLKVKPTVSALPLVTIIIPNKDHIDLLNACVQSVFEKTDYCNFEILIVENNSEDSETFAYYDRMKREHENFRVVTWQGGFNYSAINNFGVRHASGEYLVFLNNDTEVISPFWIREMLGFCQRESTAAVGAKLYYADGQVQHAGVVIGIGGFAGHIHPFSSRADTGYLGRLKAVQDISAVTAACMMVKRSVFEAIDGFDEDFVVALNDVDLCLRIREKGYLIVMDPNVELYHYESKSRGYEDTPEKQERFQKEIHRFQSRWKDLLKAGDPYYSPHLTLLDGGCGIRQEGESRQGDK